MPLVRFLLLLAAAIAMMGTLTAEQVKPGPAKSDSSDITAAGGETAGIVYHRFLDTTALATTRGALVWRMRVRDGGSRTPDLDSLPTVLDSLCIHVVLNDDTATVRTRSIAWAGLYADTSSPQLIAAGVIDEGTITFARMAGVLTAVPDDSARTFALYVAFVQRPTLGDRLRFVVSDSDAVARGLPGQEDSTSLFGPFSQAASDTADRRNLITSVPVRVDLRTYPTVAAPGTPFSAVAALLDSLDLMIPDPAGPMLAEINSMFGALTGSSVTADSTGLFWFDSLAYSFRNDSATFTLRYPGAEPAFWTMPVTGGSPYVPTVTHAGPWSTGPIPIDGTGVQVRFAGIVRSGSFLTELFDRVPVSAGPLPINVNHVLPRYIRITPDTSLTIERGLDVAIPLAGLGGFGASSSLYLLERPDSLARWASPAAGVNAGGPDAVTGHARGFGEIGLGGTSDIAVPIDDITFAADGSEDGISLSWRMTASVRSLGFQIARANAPAGPWTTIASYESDPMLLGAGNDPIERTFFWSDRDSLLHAGVSYFYMLREVKHDGESRLMGPVEARLGEIPDLPSGTHRLAGPYPNPFGGHLLFRTPAGPGEARLRIVDPLGVEVLSVDAATGAVDRTLMIDTRALPAGAYFYTIEGPSVHRFGALLKLAP